MVTLNIKTNFPQVQSALDGLHSDIRNRALVSAINKTLDQGRTAMARAIVQEFNVTTAYVRERLRIRRAVARGTLTVSGELIGGKSNNKRSANLIAFLEKKTTFKQARDRREVGTLDRLYVQVRRTGGAKPLAWGAFIGNKGRTIFTRVGRSRLPIRPLQTIDIGQMFNTKRVNAVVVETMTTKFPMVFAHEAKFYLDRWNQAQGARK